MKILAIIPARSGSKGLPEKNIKKIKNVPLIVFSIWTAVNSNLFEDVILSTDDPEYFELLKGIKITKDYIRPKELATDDSPTIDTVLHLLNWCSDRGKEYDAVMLLQPTSPFRTIEHLRAAINLMNDNKDATCVTSIVRLWDNHPARIKKLENEKWLIDFCSEANESKFLRRQDFQPPAYLRNGAIYLTRINTILNKKKIWDEKVIGMEMHEANSINIDRPIDFIVAESMIDYPQYQNYFSEFDDLFKLYNA